MMCINLAALCQKKRLLATCFFLANWVIRRRSNVRAPANHAPNPGYNLSWETKLDFAETQWFACRISVRAHRCCISSDVRQFRCVLGQKHSAADMILGKLSHPQDVNFSARSCVLCAHPWLQFEPRKEITFLAL